MSRFEVIIEGTDMASVKKQFMYEGSNGFLGEVIDYDRSKYVIVPVPFEMTTTFLKGTKFAPTEVIKASLSLENYDHETKREVRNIIYTLDDLELPPDVSKSIEYIRDTVSEIIGDKKVPVLLGGEHTLSYAASLSFGKDVMFVVFDAHADFKKNLLGTEVSHASVSRLIAAEKSITLIGVRSLSLDEKKELEARKINVIYADELEKSGNIKGISKLSGRNLYISIDMDVFDPSVANSVGTPQPGGLTYDQVFDVLSDIVKKGNVVGFDVCEAIPSQSKTTEILAAKLVQDIISLNEGR